MPAIQKKVLDCYKKMVYNDHQLNIDLQGRVQIPTGGTAREPKGMIR